MDDVHLVLVRTARCEGAHYGANWDLSRRGHRRRGRYVSCCEAKESLWNLDGVVNGFLEYIRLLHTGSGMGPPHAGLRRAHTCLLRCYHARLRRSHTRLHRVEGLVLEGGCALHLTSGRGRSRRGAGAGRRGLLEGGVGGGDETK